MHKQTQPFTYNIEYETKINSNIEYIIKLLTNLNFNKKTNIY